MRTANLCTGCGRCQPTCPVWRRYGREELSPRGWMRIIQAASKTERPDSLLPFLNACIKCGGCVSVCPVSISPMDEISATQRLGQNRLAHRKVRRIRSQTVLFPGCSAMKITGLLQTALQHSRYLFGDVDVLYGCCGAPFARSGRQKLAEALLKSLAITTKHTLKILTLCPHCFRTLRNSPLIKPEILWLPAAIKTTPPNITTTNIAYLPGCATKGENLNSPVKNLNKLNIIEIENCCGNPPVKKVKSTSFRCPIPDLVSDCPRCVFHLMEKGIRAVHTIQFFPPPHTTESVQRSYK